MESYGQSNSVIWHECENTQNLEVSGLRLGEPIIATVNLDRAPKGAVSSPKLAMTKQLLFVPCLFLTAVRENGCQ